MRGQRGSTLIEVLIALLIMAVGLLGAAAIQLNALKFTDSSSLRTRASFIAYDMMDRIRANPSGSYALADISAVPSAGSLSAPATQDLYDFGQAITLANLPNATASIVKNGFIYTITVGWDDRRAALAVNSQGTVAESTSAQSFVLTSRVAMDTVTP